MKVTRGRVLGFFAVGRGTRAGAGVGVGSIGLRGGRVIELQLVAFIMVFSASGLVPIVDLAFPVATTLYLLVISRLAFPSVDAASTPSASQEIFRGSRLFQAYVGVGRRTVDSSGPEEGGSDIVGSWRK